MSADADVEPEIPSEPKLTSWNDWKSWVALIWMIAFGLLYAAMVIREKAPWILSVLRPKD